MNFSDRLLKCSDCASDFVFTAGEQLFFVDKQFKNDPKRCKLCKAKRAGLGRTTASATGGVTALPLSRTETRTECSACGIDTTVPFKPTQGRPVLCRSCFQMKRVPAAVAQVAGLTSPADRIAVASAALEQAIAHAEAGHEPMSSSATSVEMIAEAPAAMLSDHGESVSASFMAAMADA